MEIVPSTPLRPRRTGRLALGGLAVVLVLTGLAAAFPVLMGVERVGMADDAMGSALPKGSYVLVHQVAANDVQVGDVVSFGDPAGDGSVVRRVAAVEGGWLEVVGDAPGTEAATVRAVRVRRVVSHYPWVGYPMMVLPAWPAPYLLVAFLGAVVLAWLRLSHERTRRRRHVLATVVVSREAPAQGSVPTRPASSTTVPLVVPTPPAPRAPLALS